MDLSIAMIVKNEEKNIDKTLKAISKLKESMSIEIIIVDTGSTDNTVNIAKKYTDKIFIHKWEDDFSKMRNISLEYCTGKWILVLDADEVLENPKELVNLLKNKEIDKYKTVAVNIRNYNSSSKENSSICSIYRLFKRDYGIKYIGIIHEQPTYKGPVLYSEITFNHNGYIHDDYNLMEYKFERNTKLLLKHIETCGEDIYTYYQLSQSYFVADKIKEALLYINKAVDMSEKNSSSVKSNLYVYVSYCKQLYAIKNYEKCIEICKKVINEEHNILDIYYLMSSSYFQLNNFIESIKYGKKYFELMGSSKIGKNNIEEFSLEREIDILEVIAFSYNKLGKYYDLYQLLRNNKLDKDSLLECYCLSIVMLEKTTELNELINKNQNKNIHNYIINSINEKLLSINVSKRDEFFKNYLSLDYILDLYINVVELKKDINIDYSLFEFKDFQIWKAEILIELIKNDTTNINVLSELNYNDIRKYLLILCKDYSCIRILLKFSEDNILSIDSNILILLDHIEEALIQSGRIIGDDLKKIISRRIINKHNLMKIVYNDDVLSSKISKMYLSDEEYFWYKLRFILLKKENNLNDFIKEFKEHIKEFNLYKEVYKIIFNEIKIVRDEQILRDKSSVIKIINDLINIGQVNSAKEMLNELKTIIGSTSEIYNIEGVVCYIENDIQGALNNLLNAYILDDKNEDINYNINEVLSLRGNLI